MLVYDRERLSDRSRIKFVGEKASVRVQVMIKIQTFKKFGV